MQSFEEYTGLFKLSCNTSLLDSCLQNNDYFVFEGQKPLLTPGNKTFSHSSNALIFLIITDLQLDEPTGKDRLSAPLLYAFMKDVLQEGTDPFLWQWKDLADSDPFLQVKISGESSLRPLDPDEPLFSFSFVSLAGLLETVNQFSGRIMGEINLEESVAQPFPAALKQVYHNMSFEQKAAVHGLCCKHMPGIVMPLLFMSGEISPVEYAKGLIALRIKSKEQFSQILADTAKVQSWLDCGLHRHRTEKKIAGIIKEGEGDTIEFKSTLRWDIRAGKTNPAIEHACLKTISAFLNSWGGTLLIGVRDDGSIEGIETDRLPNEDKFLLHIWTLIRTCLGKDFTPYIRTRLEKVSDKTVCMVSCRPSTRPVFLKQPGFTEEMYIRVGPSSNAMDISEALKYIEDHYQ